MQHSQQKTVVILILIALIGLGLLLAPAQLVAQSGESGGDQGLAETAVSATTTPLALKPVCPPAPTPHALLAGDSWAQFMWDDDSYNDLFDKYGHGDKTMLSRSLGSDPGPGYSGPAYAISGSEARQWVDTANFPYIANIVADLNANPNINIFVLSIGGNDFLAGRPAGGWYKDMDLDAAGAEAALFATVEADTTTIMNAALAVRPEMEALLSSYDYPNFNVGFLFCWIYACGKREDLSRDPSNDLITDVELNGMMVVIEQERRGWTNSLARVGYDNSIGLMHYYYGDGVAGPGVLPFPGQTPPDYQPLPGGNPLLPSLRANFRIVGDPIHLDYDGYRYKISNQIHSFFLPRFRPQPMETFFALGGALDGWTTGTSMGTNGIYVGDDGTAVYHGLVTFDTSSLPDRAVVTNASLYLLRGGASGANPFNNGDPTVDVATGSFGAAPIELSDVTAVPTAADVGCVHGSAAANNYAVRVDLVEGGRNAINNDGTTQFRLAYPTANPNPNHVAFSDGDAVLAAPQIEYQTKTTRQHLPDGTTRTVTQQVMALPLPSLADYMGSSKPFLDVDYCLRPEMAVLVTNENNGELTLNWSAVDADEYELWTTINAPYIPTNQSCETANNCIVTTATSVTMQGVADSAENYTYTVVPRNECAGGSSSAATATAEFDFDIVPGNA
ncbi:MAG: hypothetical protein AAF614_34165 [Chloroflexota bacterium]